jgi:hypothetical protein
MHCHKLEQTKTALIFVLPFVSLAGSKMGRFLIIRDDSNNHASSCDVVVCALLMTLENSSKNSVLPFRKPPFYPLNYGNKFSSRMPDADLNARGESSKSSTMLHRISAISRLRLVTSSLRKMAWRCFFTIGKLKQASSAIS